MTPHKVVRDKNYAIDCGTRIIGERERERERERWFFRHTFKKRQKLKMNM